LRHVSSNFTTAYEDPASESAATHQQTTAAVRFLSGAIVERSAQMSSSFSPIAFPTALIAAAMARSIEDKSNQSGNRR
jgi:hypothetical protein